MDDLGTRINLLAASTAGLLTAGLDVKEVKRILLFVDGLRVSLANILACKLAESVGNGGKNN